MLAERMSNGKINILLAKNHVVVRESIRRFLEREANFEVVGEAGDGEEAVRMASQLKPDVIVMDISMPKLNGIEATKQIKALQPSAVVLILTAYDYEQYIFPLLEAGAAGYLLKDVSGRELVSAIQTVYRGEAVLHPAVARKVMERLRQPKVEPTGERASDLLTERETSILKMAARGMSNNDIAQELHLSVRTIESHLGSIFNKLRVGSRTEAVIQAMKRGWFTLKELAKVNVKTLLSKDGLRLAKEVRRRLVGGEAVAQPYEQHLVRKDGTEATLMLTTSPIFSDGQLIAFQNIARDITEEKRMQENMRFYLQEIARAQEEERKRIARELHDSTAQTLIALLHQLENLMNDEAKLPVREAKALWGFYEQIRDVLHEVRRFSRDLRPSILDDLGLLPALEWVTGELKKEYGVETAFKVVGSERRFSQEAELILFRIVQEALRNIAKHAQASKAEVKVEFEKQKIRVTISDDGVGFQLPESLGELLHSGKLGLVGMQERVQLLGGNLQLKSKVGKGTTIVATAPI